MAKIIAPVVTIFNEEEKPDYAGNKKVIDFLIEGGLDGILVLGSAGEFPDLNEQERLDMVSGKIPSQAFYSAFGDPRTGAYNAAAVSQFLSQAASDARAQQAWNDLNEQARLERAVQKYATLIGKGAYVNKLEIEDGVDAANQVFGGKYVAKRYSSVPDSLVSVSSGEIKSFYNAHKEMFKQSPSRTLSSCFGMTATAALYFFSRKS